MREKFFEKVHLDTHFKSTSTQNQYSRNEFRESAHFLRWFYRLEWLAGVIPMSRQQLLPQLVLAAEIGPKECGTQQVISTDRTIAGIPSGRQRSNNKKAVLFLDECPKIASKFRNSLSSDTKYHDFHTQAKNQTLYEE